MKLIFATADFVYAGRARTGFPLVLNDALEPAQPFHDYLVDRLLQRGRLLNLKTWEAYGRRLWDFARFLHANGLRWDQPSSSDAQSVVRVYRDWQAHDSSLDVSTINDRLEIVADLYRWAHRTKRLDALPFTHTEVQVRGVQHDLSHVTRGVVSFSRPDLLLDEWDKEPAFLVAEELKAARLAIRAPAQRLLFDLMARVGLRSVEARTFPLDYVFDPRSRAGLKPGSFIEQRLDPRDMEIKFGKPRVVHIPYSLMEDMHTYAVVSRNDASVEGRAKRPLLLTSHSKPYSRGAAVKVFKDLGQKLGFAVRPLMLRHSYAIHTLLLLRSRPSLKIEPLLYVRDRLGHKSVQQTLVYLRQIERLLGAEVLSMMHEFDDLYGVTSALATTQATPG